MRWIVQSQRFGLLLIIASLALTCGCDPSPPPPKVPVLTAAQREQIIADRSALRAAEAASLTDVEIAVAKEPVPTETYFRCDGDLYIQ
jgi:hypothetical protein